MPNDQMWVNPGTRANPGIALSAIYRAVSAGVSGGNAALGWEALDGALDHGSRLRITTDGTNSFGAKLTAKPVVWDMGQDVRLAGTADTVHAGASDGASVVSLGVFSGDAHISTSRAHRHARINRHYVAPSADDLDASVNYDSKLNVLSASRKFYSAFRLRVGCNPRFIDNIPYSALAGTFDTGAVGELGEPITITIGGNPYAASIIDIDKPAGYFSIYSPDLALSSANTVGGVSVVGNSSGATCSLSLASGYLATPAAKLWRIDQEALNGVLAVVQSGTEQFWIESNSGGVDSINLPRSANAANFSSVVGPGDYMFAELYVDWSTPSSLTATLTYMGPLGRVTKTIPGVDGSANYLDLPVKILGMGLDSSIQHPVALDFGECYADETAQRVFIGDASTYATCSEFEIQYPLDWTDGQIDIELYFGANESLDGKYLYVIGADNTPINSTGVAL